MFDTQTQSYGPIKPGESHTFEFPYSGLTIVGLEGSCGCTNVANRDGKVFATYKSTPVPIHLKQIKQDSYTAIKYIYVDYYVDKPSQVEKLTLTINVLVEDK